MSITRMGPSPVLVGVVNITPDSFYDGGKYLQADAALQHARKLYADGANIVELGAASSNPDASPVSPEDEIARLDPVLEMLISQGTHLAVDSCTPQVQCYAAMAGVHIINDVTGFPAGVPGPVVESDCKLVVMHSVQQAWRADRRETNPSNLLDDICRFFDGRIKILTESGVAEGRTILDPGMGFFLGSNWRASVAVLREVTVLRSRFAIPIMISVSRKSFLRQMIRRSLAEVGAATLAAELYAAASGVEYIRTHDVAALSDSLAVLQRLAR
jgi:dihydropteroate synthase type 2